MKEGEEEYNPQHDAPSLDEEEIPQTEKEIFLSKNSKITQSLSPYHNQGRMAAQSCIMMTPTAHTLDIASTSYMFASHRKYCLDDDKIVGFL